MEKIYHSEGHSFIADLVSEGTVCVDLGANMGNFALFVEQNTKADIVSVEPVSALFDNLVTNSRRTKIRAIVQAEPGEATINIYENCCPTTMDVAVGGQSSQETVACRTLRDVFESLGDRTISLVKVDIEGSEIDLLQQAPAEVLLRGEQYTVEFHDFMDIKLRPGVEAATERMQRIGFEVIHFSRDNTNVLFVRKDKLRYGVFSKLWMAGPVKYSSGISRIIERRQEENAGSI